MSNKTMKLKKITDHVFCHTDSCNVYLIKDGDAAFLIDFGRGEILHDAEKMGNLRIQALLHTHHHREQCQGDMRAVQAGIPVCVPKQEALLFENVQEYWNDLYAKTWDCNGAPYVRPLLESILVAQTLSEGDTLALGSTTVRVLETPGHSPGGISFLAEIDGMRIGFVGDLLMDEGKLVNLYDSEWDYGYGAGLKTLVNSCRKLARWHPDILLPSHGRPILNAENQCLDFAEKLEQFVDRYYLRDYGPEDEVVNPASTAPSVIPEADEVSPHIIRWKENSGNMYIILGKNHTALLVDAGIIHYEDSRKDREALLSRSMQKLMDYYRIEKIEAVVLSHYHGDHLDILYYLQEKYHVKLWCYENMAEVVEHPERFNLTCLLPWYGIPGKFTVDRILHEEECLEWGGYCFHIFHLPGQTWHAMGMETNIDGARSVFSGDNLFYSRDRSGHDAFVMRNRAVPEEGFIKCAETLKKLDPDRLLCGHSILIDKPGPQIERFFRWSYYFRDQLKGFSPYEQYEYLIDPYWAELYPYRSLICKERRITKTLKIRNYSDTDLTVSGSLCCPEGWTAAPERFQVAIMPRQTAYIEFIIEIPDNAVPGRYPVAADIQTGNMDFGQIFDSLIELKQ